MVLFRRSLALLLVLIVHASTVRAGQSENESAQAQARDLKKLTLEELSQIDVTSVSRRTERLSNVAAAVSVVRRDDIIRSGVTTLAEAMRLGDAIDVARVNGNTWAISARGFNISTANKILVLVDGRSTYSPLFAGTFWDAQDTLLADLERIEVIRGPGASIWGPNAVNGVINIISRPTADTVGNVLTLIAGTDELPVVSGRHGGRLGDGHYRVFGKYRQRGPQRTSDDKSAQDEIVFGQGGFRFDSSAGGPQQWFVSGAAYKGSLGLADRDDGEINGGHLLARWAREIGGGRFQVQGYYDRTHRKVPLQFEEKRNAGDIDAQHELRNGRHSLVGGGQLHVSRGNDVGTAGFFFQPETRTYWLTTAFAQDEIEIVRNRFYLIAGTKVAANSYTGAEVQPTIRIRVQPDDRQMAWAAVSRAVRLPTRFDTDLRLRNPVTNTVTLTGTEDFDAESVVAYEGGYRARLHSRLLADIAVFFNRYDSLRSEELRFVPTPRLFLENQLNARTGGVEVGATAELTRKWRIHGSYAWLRKSLTFDPGSTDPTGGRFEANDPSHLASLRSQVDLPRGFSFDAFLRYAGTRPAPRVPAYGEVDLQLGYRVSERWELSLVGQNLLHESHQEFNFTPTIELRRGVYLRSVWRF
jgi:iron complex outermembrane recepter protein